MHDPLDRLRSVASDETIRLAACCAADAACQTLVGQELFTVMRLHRECLEVERVYSSRPDVYPPGGRKAKEGTEWAARVITGGAAFHGTTADDIRWAFDDHGRILSLGLECVINVPLRLEGRVIGTMNLLAGPGALRAEHVPAAEAIAEMLAPALRDPPAVSARPRRPA